MTCLNQKQPTTCFPALLSIACIFFCFYSRLLTILWHFFHFQIVPLWPRCWKNLLHFSGDWSIYSMASWMALSKKGMFRTSYSLFMIIVEREWLAAQTLFLIRYCFDFIKRLRLLFQGKTQRTDRQTDAPFPLSRAVTFLGRLTSQD